MGIAMTARALSDEKIRAIMDDPPLVWRIVEPDNPQAYLRASGHARPQGWPSRLFRRRQPMLPVVPDFAFSEAESAEVDLDKSWDGVNFCLKQLIPPGACANLFEDGKPVGDIEIFNGPALCLGSDEVAAIARHYAAISAADLLARYAQSDMGDVYLSGVWLNQDEDSRAYLADNFLALQAFVLSAARNRLGILVCYS